MPVTIARNKDGSYMVRTPKRIHARHTTLANAKAQKAIIDAADAGHPFATGKKGKR